MKPAKKEIKKDALADAISEIRSGSQDPVTKKKSKAIVDIMTFCDDPQYLDLPSSNLVLWLPQRIILKTFYMGTRGNENLKLTQEECEWLYKNKGNEERDGVTFEKNIGEVIEKLLKKEKESFNFTELHLCMGRRGSKTILSSIISAYEAYKLLTIGDGDPHKFYRIPKGEDIHIINVALSVEQAGILFGMIRQRLMDGPFFRERVANATTTEIRLFTDEDIKRKKKVTNLEIKGSVVILCGHSNPDTLRGKSAVLILFDELAFYDEAGKTPGSEFYNALEPSTKKFKRYGDARLVEISSPNSTVGIFYDLFRQAKTTNHILSFQLPTWCVNEDISYESLQDERIRNPENFAREFGAQWVRGGVYGNYFDPGLVDRCINSELQPHTRPLPALNYYIHVDPSSGGNKYAAVMVARKNYVNSNGKRRCIAILANIWVWEPVPGVGIMFNEVDKEMAQICARFNPISVSYDQYNSGHSMQFLRSRGFRTIETSFNKGFKTAIYQNLRELMSYQPSPELLLYNDTRLILELKALKVRPTMRGQTITPDKRGEVKTDDLCVHPSTIVFTDSYPKEIKDICVGEKVLTASGTYQKVINKIEHNRFSNILEIRPFYGDGLILTDNHPVEVLIGGERKWKRSVDITTSDYVIKSFDNSINNLKTIDLERYSSSTIGLNKHHNINEYITNKKIRQQNPNAKWHNRLIFQSEEFGYIMGIYLADGSLGNHGITFAGNINEKVILNKIRNGIFNIFGVKSKWFYQQGNACQLNINSQIIKRLFVDIFKCRISINKFIPNIFMNAPLRFQESLLRGYFDGDGCYYKKNKVIIFTTTSIFLALQVQQLLLRFRIVSSFMRSKREGTTCVIRGRQVKHNKDLLEVRIGDSTSFNLARKILGINDFKTQSKFHPKKYVFGDNFIACKVKSVKKSSSNSVVNMEIENDHSYVSNSINSHNCDCLAGACAMATNAVGEVLPEPVTIYMPHWR